MQELSRWSGQFSDPALESSFRAEYVADSLRHARAAVVVGAVAYLLFVLNDLLRFGWGETTLLRLPMRLAVAAAALWVLPRLARTSDTRIHDRLVGGFGVLVAASYTAVNTLSYAPGVIVSVSMVVLTLAAFIGLSIDFRWNVIVGASCILGFSLSMFWNRDPAAFGTTLLLCFTALSSGLLMRQMNALRRRAFLAWRSEHEARDALARSSESLRRLFMAVPVPFALARLSDGRVLQANDVAMSSFQLSEQDLEHLNVADLLARSVDQAALADRMSRDDAVDRFELRVRRRDGLEIDALLSAHRVEHNGERCVLLGMTDVSDLKRLERDLTQQAATDILTGLSNRRTFMDQLARDLAQARRQQQPLSLLYLDLDHFKSVNDRFGHAAGDEVLKAIADTLVHEVRAGDMCARLGGEEFAVLLPGAALARALEAAERIRQAVQQRELLVGGKPLRITVSIGVATLANADDPQRLLAAADAALFEAKHRGRNRVEHAAQD